MVWRYRPLKSKISRVLVLYVVLFSSVITLILTAMQLYNDYRYDLSLIDQRLAQIEASNLESLASNLWTLNHNAIGLQLEGLLRLPDLAYLEVKDASGEILARTGEQRHAQIVSRQFEIRYTHRGEPRKLGTLYAVATLEHVYQRLIDTFVVILITQGIKTFLVSAFIIFIVTHLITRHLTHFAAHAQKIDPLHPGEQLALQRRFSPMTKGDELDRLTDAYNDMLLNVRRAYSELAYSESMLERAQQIGDIGSWEMNAHNGQVAWSNEAKSILQYSELEKGSGFEGYIACTHHGDRKALREGLRKIHEADEPLLIEHRINCDDGTEKVVEFRAQYYLDHQFDSRRLIGTVHDVTEHCRQRDALHHMANFDSLTNLPNRWSLNSRLDSAISSIQQMDGHLMLALLDLDGFKEVNDSLGHQAGDDLLRQIKPRLEPILRDSDFLARLGGDEFAVLLHPIESQAEGLDIITDVIDAMGEPFDLKIMQAQIGVSIGISLCPAHASDASTLLRYADVAMYYAKRNKLHHAVYSPEIDPHTPRRLELMSDMTRAIREDQLVLYYQPKIRADDGRIQGVEALVRWPHPAHGLITPDEFVPLCEISDLIGPMTLWVLQRALRDFTKWQQDGFDMGVAINVSVRNMLDSRFPQAVVDLLRRFDSGPGSLTLEITESALMEDPKRAKTNIDRLHAAGVKISIDDFGTGYSSLSYLKHLPVQELKIDRGFVLDMLADENDAVIVRSTVDLAHCLGIQVTAEGVENAAVTAELKRIRCDHLQGYHIARPMPLDALIPWLSNWKYESADESKMGILVNSNV